MSPPDLSTYPDKIKLMFWQWVTDEAMRVKDRELARGWDKDGQVHPLRPRTIKYRKSDVGPVTKNAPRLEPALKRSRVRSLLRGRAHHQSAEIYWDFDAVTGDSFAVILHYAAEAGHDVFGISDRGTAQVRREALNRWQAWKVEAGHARPKVGIPGALPTPKREVKKPIPKREVKGRMDLENFDISSSGEKLKKAIEAGEFTGFRRLNARGEQWKPGMGIPPAASGTAIIKPKPKPKPKPKAYDIEFSGKLPEDIKAYHEKTIREIPEPVLNTLKANGIKFAYAEKLVDRYPELATKQPSGWPAGYTWEQAEGLFRPYEKEIFVSRTSKSGFGSYFVSSRQRGVLFHETGHGLDQALNYISRGQEWQDAHAMDVSRLTYSQMQEVAYELQPGYRGWEETFAELFALELGEGSAMKDIRSYFPNCVNLLRTIIKDLK